MRVTRVLFGTGVGLASGIAVLWINRDQQRHNVNVSGQKIPTGACSELGREIETIKRSFYNIIGYSKQVKNDGIQQGSDVANEFETLIGDSKSNISPNIEKLKSHIGNLQNRGGEISNTFSEDKNNNK